jgi:transcription initiation factor TFIID subunit 10
MLGSLVRKIPDELVEHYLGRSGFHCPDLRL